MIIKSNQSPKALLTFQNSNLIIKYLDIFCNVLRDIFGFLHIVDSIVKKSLFDVFEQLYFIFLK